tara:strand:+ start:258 stop:446 length:189 start_codon:yes stop_codon:yes gene_type:complete
MNFKEEMDRILKMQEDNMKNERNFIKHCKSIKDDEINDAAIELGLHADDDRDEIINKLNGGS